MPDIATTFVIRQWQASDSVSQLTELLHRAYKPLADAGMRFLATHQDDEITLRRISKGVCFVAQRDDRIIATINYQPPGIAKGCPWYEQEHVAYFGQFAVEPELQRSGVGAALLQHVERQAKADGATELSLDTSERAARLIEYYTKRGYRFIEYVQWDTVNYRSMILSKAL